MPMMMMRKPIIDNAIYSISLARETLDDARAMLDYYKTEPARFGKEIEKLQYIVNEIENDFKRVLAALGKYKNIGGVQKKRVTKSKTKKQQGGYIYY